MKTRSKKDAPVRAKSGRGVQSKQNNVKAQWASKCKVAGARRVWGPFYLCSPNAVQKIDWYSCRIRKKTRELAENKTIWWFVIHGDEQDLCKLDEEWDKVHLQTNWRLENCFAPSNNNSLSPTSPVSDTNSPPATGTTGPAITDDIQTMTKDTNTSPPASASDNDEHSSATTTTSPILLDPNQPPVSIPNGSDHDHGGSIMDSVVDESSHV